MEQAPSEEKRFMANVLDLTNLVHELATICWDAGRRDINPQLVVLAENYLEQYDPTKLIEIFINHSYEHWSKIKHRDENFFINNANAIFKYLPIDTNNINAFKIFFTAMGDDGDYIIIQEDRDAIWDIFDSLIKICIKYIHRVRGVKLIETDRGLRPVYKTKKFPDIKVREQANIWGIELPIPGKE